MELEELNNIIEAVYVTRDLVNEPVIYLNAVKLSEEIKKLGKRTANNDFDFLSNLSSGFTGGNRNPKTPTFL